MNTRVSNNQAILILNAIPQVGPITFKKLMEAFEYRASRVLEASRSELKKIDGIGDVIVDNILSWAESFNLEREEKYLENFNASFISCLDPEYPPLLKEIYDSPMGLYYLGDCRPSLRTIAIVGSRRSTLYGQKVAKEIASNLARMEFCIVSGMARGIDSAAHEGALEVGGKTVAILGCGPDIIYPPENKKLYEQIKNTGAVISEFPFGRKADKLTFPRRNRIISGMSQAVVVIETNSNGGSMITARMANEQGRHVFAVPGRIDQVSSHGCHELIRDGATLCRRAEDILEDLNYLSQLELDIGEQNSEKKHSTTDHITLTDVQKKVFLELQALSIAPIDALAQRTKLCISELSSALLMLELKKLVVKRIDGTFEAKI